MTAVESDSPLASSAAPVQADFGSDAPEGSLIKYPAYRGLSLAFVLMAVMMHTIDSTIANVALPHMQGALSATVDQISWVITGYIVAAAIGTPSVAWLSERYGAKRTLLVSVAGFTASSMLCGVALSLTNMVFFRVMQGMSGAALIPIGQAVMMSAFKKEDYPKAMGIFGFGVMFGPIIGPTLGGYITEISNWRWVFFINLPIGALAFFGISVLIKDNPLSKSLKFDGYGFVALVTAIACFQLMMDRGHGQGWFASKEIVAWVVLSAMGLYYYVYRTATASAPLFKKPLFKDRNFVFGNILFFAVMGNMVSTVVMLPTLMQSVMGYPVVKAGWLLAPRGLGMMITMVMAPRLSQRFDPRLLSAIGLAIAGFALWDQSHLSVNTTEWDFVRAGFFHGAGLGIVFVQMSALCFSTVPDHLRLEASTVFNISRNVGASVCASLAMTTLSRNIQINTAELGENITLFSPALELSPFVSETTMSESVPLAIMHAGIAHQAAIIAYQNNFFIIAMLSFLSIFMLVLLKPEMAAPTVIK